MKTICVMRDVFKAMARFEDAFEKVYQAVSYTHLTLPTKA